MNVTTTIVVIVVAAVLAYILWPLLIGKRCTRCGTRMLQSSFSKRPPKSEFDHWDNLPRLIQEQWMCPKCQNRDMTERGREEIIFGDGDE